MKTEVLVIDDRQESEAFAAYVASLKPKPGIAQCGVDFAAHCGLAFGVTDAERAVFNEHDLKVIEWQHEKWIAGELHPMAGTFTAYFLSLVEYHTPGKPKPADRNRVLLACMRQVIAGLRNPKVISDPDTHDKRNQFLKDLRDIEEWDAP